MLARLAAWVARWRRKRRWPVEMQIEYLRALVNEDARWMAHDPIVSALCERYQAALLDDWESQPIEGVSNFRRRIGLEPRYGRS